MNLFLFGKSYINHNPNYMTDNSKVCYDLDFQLIDCFIFILKLSLFTIATVISIYFLSCFNSISAIKFFIANLNSLIIDLFILVLTLFVASKFKRNKTLSRNGGTTFLFSHGKFLHFPKEKYAPLMFKGLSGNNFSFPSDMSVLVGDTILTPGKTIKNGDILKLSYIPLLYEGIESSNTFTIKINNNNLYLATEMIGLLMSAKFEAIANV